MKKLSVFVIGVAMLFCASSVFAEATVVSVKGTAAYNLGGKWLPMQAGMKIRNGAKISTGVKSVVVLKLVNSTVTVQPLSMMKIYEDKLVRDESDTKIAIRRGSIKAEVNTMKEVKTVFKVATPVATSSVRGTEFSIETGPSGTITVVESGAVSVQDTRGQSQIVKSGWQAEKVSDGIQSVVSTGRAPNDFTILNNLTPVEEQWLRQNGGDPNNDIINQAKVQGGLNLDVYWP